MSVATLLLPWVASTYSRSQLEQWRTSADRLSAGIVVGIDYPTPEHVSHVMEQTLDAVGAMEALNLDTNHRLSLTDPADLILSTDEILQELVSLTQECREECARADEAEGKLKQKEAELLNVTAERDALQRQLDANEKRTGSLRRALLRWVDAELPAGGQSDVT